MGSKEAAKLALTFTSKLKSIEPDLPLTYIVLAQALF